MVNFRVLFSLFCLSVFYPMFSSEKNVIWVNVFVHGIIKIPFYLSDYRAIMNNKVEGSKYYYGTQYLRMSSDFYLNQPMQELGLHKINLANTCEGNGAVAVALIQDKQYKNLTREKNFYYTFGWSGLLSRLHREEDSGNTALINAAKRKRNDTTKLLLDSGANVNLQDKGGNTALMWAAIANNNEGVKQLIKAGADLNLQDQYGNTAFINAIRFGNSEIVEQLLESGADIYIKKEENKTAIDIAREENPAILKLIEDYLEQRRTAIAQHLPSVLAQIAAEYLGYPSKERAEISK